MISKRIEFCNENKDLEIEQKNNLINGNLELLKTIIIPNKLENLAKNLPKPNYITEANNQSFRNDKRVRGNHMEV